jgi:hypothetical protein
MSSFSIRAACQNPWQWNGNSLLFLFYMPRPSFFIGHQEHQGASWECKNLMTTRFLSIALFNVILLWAIMQFSKLLLLCKSANHGVLRSLPGRTKTRCWSFTVGSVLHLSHYPVAHKPVEPPVLHYVYHYST